MYISGVVSKVACAELYLQRCEYFGTTLFPDVSYNIIVVWFVRLQLNDVLSTLIVSRAKPLELSSGISL